MDYSKAFKQETTKAGLEINERTMADLMAAGWKETDAYVQCYGMNPAYSDAWHRQKLKEITGGENFARYLQKRTRQLERAGKADTGAAAAAVLDVEDVEIMDKEAVMKELIRLAFSLPVNDPKRADILMKYADVTQMKREDTGEAEDKTVHYYLPLNCKICSLYVKAKSGEADMGGTEEEE